MSSLYDNSSSLDIMHRVNDQKEENSDKRCYSVSRRPIIIEHPHAA